MWRRKINKVFELAGKFEEAPTPEVPAYICAVSFYSAAYRFPMLQIFSEMTKTQCRMLLRTSPNPSFLLSRAAAISYNQFVTQKASSVTINA